MSHHASGIAPHVLTFTPSAFAAAGAATIAVNGANLSTTCQLSMPAALGTVVSGPVLTNVSSSQADATWTVNILAPTDTSYACAVSNGGLDASGVPVNIFHGFDPSDLLSDDGQYYDSTDTVNANPQLGNWDPTSDYAGSPGTGFGYGSGATLTTIGGARAFDGNLLATSNPNQFPNGVSGQSSLSWAMVVEATAAWWVSGGHFWLCQPAAYLTFGIGGGTGVLPGGGWFSIKDQYATLDLTNTIYANGHFPIGIAAAYTVVGTHDASTATTSFYINGTLARSVVTVGYATSTNSIPVHSATTTDLKLGDMLFIERTLTPAEVTDLHNHWSAKFGI